MTVVTRPPRSLDTTPTVTLSSSAPRERAFSFFALRAPPTTAMSSSPAGSGADEAA